MPLVPPKRTLKSRAVSPGERVRRVQANLPHTTAQHVTVNCGVTYASGKVDHVNESVEQKKEFWEVGNP